MQHTQALQPDRTAGMTESGDKGRTEEETFWTEFAADYWERQAGVMGPLPGEPLVTQTLLFDVMIEASELYRDGHRGVDICFWLDGRKQGDFANCLPFASDGDLHGYHARLDKQLQGQDYTYLLAEPHLYAPPFWQAARRVLHTLYKFTGMPSGWVDTAIFAGRYRRTPFGVHQGPMSVMTFPVVGEKQFRLWSPSYLSSHPDLKDAYSYDGHVAASDLITCQPGAISYWPSREWHIAEGSDTFTAAWSLGFWVNPREQHSLHQVVGELGHILQDTDPHGPEDMTMAVPAPADAGLSLPARWGQYADDLRRILDDGSFDNALQAAWMRKLSSSGFKKIPALGQAPPLVDDDLLHTAAEAQLLLHPADKESLYIAANGHVVTLPNDPRIRAVLMQFNEGLTLKLRDILDVCVGKEQEDGSLYEASADQVMELLQLLVSTGVLACVE